jgi:uncharacterized iron-regulated membrane protein
MKQSFRLSMHWLHTWTGLVAGWIIFLIFFNGSAAYFKQEITTWMKPELAAAIDPAKSVSGAVAFLKAKAPNAETWTISVPDARYPGSDVTWQLRPKPGGLPVEEDDDPPPPPDRRATIDATGRPLATRDTEGGDYFSQFHFALHYLPRFLGLLLVGLASLGLLVALTTGVIIHRRIFSALFTFRPRQGVRSWLDAHTTFGILALPFHLMIAYSGVAILMFFLMPWAMFANYSNPQGYFETIVSRNHTPPASGHLAPLVSVNVVLSSAEAIWKGGRAERIRVTNPGDASATITIYRHPNGPVADGDASLTFKGVTGALVRPISEPSTASTASSVVFGLHEGHFARPALRWLLFLCGAIGTAMVACGLILWTQKRRRKTFGLAHGRRGFKLVETFNVVVIAGYPAATAALFWANRLLPLSTASRANAEILCAFGCWGLLLVWSAARPTRKAWAEISSVTALLFLLLPIVNAGTSSRGTFTNVMRGDPLYIGFDLVSLALGLVFATTAFLAGRHTYFTAPPA